MFTKRIFLLAIIIASFVTSCYKDDDEVNPSDDTIPQSMEELDVSQNFDWKTTKDIEIQLKGSVNDVVKVKSSKGEYYLKAFLQSGDTYKSTITIPTYENEVTLVYGGTNYQVPIVDNEITYRFN